MSQDLVTACMWLDLPPARKLVLLALCERADLRTGRCWPSRDEIALRASLTPRNASPHLKALGQDDGDKKAYVKIGPRPWREGMTTTRWVNVDRILTEGQTRRDWFLAEQKQLRLQRQLLDSGSPEASDDSSLAQISLFEAGDDDDLAGDVDGIQQGTMTALAGDAATLVTVRDPSDLEPSQQPSGEPSHLPPYSPPAPPSAMGFQERVRQELKGRMTGQNYETWFRGCSFAEIGGELLITAPSDLTANWIETRMKSLLTSVASAMELDGFRVRRD